MANNRMYMVCNVCEPTEDWQIFSNGVLYMGKYYPCTESYASMSDEELGSRIHKFLKDHNHPEVASEHYSAGAGQENPVRISYERKGLPIIEKTNE